MLPTVQCRGHCWPACSIAAMSALEAGLVASRHEHLAPRPIRALADELGESFVRYMRLIGRDEILDNAAVYVMPVRTMSVSGKERLMCAALTDDLRCAVYEDRPMICRMYGAIDDLECGHGCTRSGDTRKRWSPEVEP